jgi:hypothetical protein
MYIDLIYFRNYLGFNPVAAMSNVSATDAAVVGGAVVEVLHIAGRFAGQTRKFYAVLGVRTETETVAVLHVASGRTPASVFRGVLAFARTEQSMLSSIKSNTHTAFHCSYLFMAD